MSGSHDLDNNGQELVSGGEAANQQGVTPVDDANVEPLTDSEAVLLALGPRLMWEAFGEGHWQSQFWGEERTLWYAIKDNSPDDGSRESGSHPAYLQCAVKRWGIDWRDWEDAAPDMYPTLAAAKAACERHHATGKWE